MSLGGGNIAQGRSNTVYIVTRELYMHILLGKSYIVYMSPRRSYVAHFAHFAHFARSQAWSLVTRRGFESSHVHFFFPDRAHRWFESSRAHIFVSSHTFSNRHITFVLQYIITILSILSHTWGKQGTAATFHAWKQHTWRARTGSAHVPCGSCKLGSPRSRPE
jgi:hypothetical protein